MKSITDSIRRTMLAGVLCAALISVLGYSQTDAKDCPMYNRDVLGTRHNPGEKAIGPTNASQLVEKWRFPAMGSDLEIGVIHATPVVVAATSTGVLYSFGLPGEDEVSHLGAGKE